MNTPRMTEKELAEHERRVRISRTKTGWVPAAKQRVRSGGRAPGLRVGVAGNTLVGRPGRIKRTLQNEGSQVRNLASSPPIQTFFVPGPLPGANDIIRKHHMVYSRLKSQWGLTIARCIFVAKLKPVGYCRIEFVWREANDKRDDDNVTFAKKFVLDALRDTKIIKDDRRKFVHSVTDRVIVDTLRPGVEVTLIPVCVEVT